MGGWAAPRCTRRPAKASTSPSRARHATHEPETATALTSPSGTQVGRAFSTAAPAVVVNEAAAAGGTPLSNSDPVTGQVRNVFPDSPQVPFTEFRFHYKGGPTAVLSSPSTCGTYTAVATMTPFSGGAAAAPSDTLRITAVSGS